MDKIIPIAILVLFIILTASWLFSRYRMCPPDKILIVFGKVGTGQPAKCYHGGSTFVLPVLQSYSYLDLNPINIDVPLQGALSSQNIRVDVPSSFIVGISTLPEIMQNAAARLLGRSREEIRTTPFSFRCSMAWAEKTMLPPVEITVSWQLSCIPS